MDLNLYEFDFDLTFAMFFLNADEKVYARYGGRDGKDADNRQSLAGLNHTMRSVLAMHQQKTPVFVPRTDSKPFTTRDLASGGKRGCLHCHNVKEGINRKLVADGDWSRDLVYRYPLPDNLGFRLEVNRGNVIDRVETGTVAEKIGLKKGDVVRQLGLMPVHSIADAMFALDKAPGKGTLKATWVRGSEEMTGSFDLAMGWRKSDITWRTSMRRLVPTLPVAGTDLSAGEKKAIGLPEKALAFRQKEQIAARAKEAGLQPGDVILGIEGQTLETKGEAFRDRVRREYLVGDQITLSVLRDGKRLTIPLTLAGR